jgi:hypothetical protein
MLRSTNAETAGHDHTAAKPTGPGAVDPTSPGPAAGPGDGDKPAAEQRHDHGRAGSLLVYGAYDGSVAALDLPVDDAVVDSPAAGTAVEPRFKTDVGGFPFAVACDGSASAGAGRIYAATAAGEVVALSTTGALVFRHTSPRPVYSVAPGTFLPATRLVACGGIHRELEILREDGTVAFRHPVRYFVHRIVCGDFDGDGLDEIFLMDGREEAVLLELTPRGLRELWRTQIYLPEEYANWENPANTYKPFAAIAGDIDGDGVDEIILGDSFNNRQTVLVMSPDGSVRWVTDPLSWWAGESTWYEFFSTAFVALCDYPRDVPGKKIVSAAGGLVRVHSCTGELLASAESRVGFADVLVDGDTLYLGSTPNGDDTVYRVDLAPGFEEEIRGLSRHGRAAEIGANLQALRRQARRESDAGRAGATPASSTTADADPASPDTAGAGQGSLATADTAKTESTRHDRDRPQPPFELQQFSLPKDDITREAYRHFVDSFEEEVPYQLFRHTVSLRAMEEKPVLDENGEPWNLKRFNTDLFHGVMSVEEIVATARRIEEQRIPTVFGVGHNCNPSVQLTTAERMLLAAPNYLVGFQTAEDVSHETIYRYAKHFIGPLCDLCLKYGEKKVVIKNKVLWWLDAPANRGLYEELFSGPRRRVLVAATEESNARWSDINLMARMSLRYAGLVGAMKVHIHRDMFCYNRFHQWEFPKSGHPFLRMLVAHTVMGASVFSMGISHVVTDGQRPTAGLRFNDLGRESTEIFYHLLGKKLVFPPAPAELANISSVGLVMHEPSAKWLTNAHNNHRPWQEEEDDETLRALLPRLHCGWGNAPLPAFALSKVMFHKNRVFDGEVPATPFGHILMLPSHFDRSSIDDVKEWWHTDGIYLWPDPPAGDGSDGPPPAGAAGSPAGGDGAQAKLTGRAAGRAEAKLTGRAAGRALEEALLRGARDLAFRVTGDDVFYQVVRMEDEYYRLFVIDPGWLDPAMRRAVFHIQADGTYTVRDALNGDNIPVTDGRFTIDVPAGTFRILDATRRS